MPSKYRLNPPKSPEVVAFRAACGRLGAEDTLTQLVARAMVDIPPLGQDWFHFLAGDLPLSSHLEVSVFPYSEADRPDMAITSGSTRIVFEHKLSAAEGVNQIERYLELCRREARETGLKHKLAFVAPTAIELVGSVYSHEDFILIGGRHPQWSDFGALLKKQVISGERSLTGLFKLFEEMYFLPIEPDLSAVDFLENSSALGNSARIHFEDFILAGWGFGPAWDRELCFIPPERVKAGFPGLLFIELSAARPLIEDSRPVLFFEIALGRSQGIELEPLLSGLENRLEAADFSVQKQRVSRRSGKCGRTKISAMRISFDFEEIWYSPGIESFLEATIPKVIELFDP